MKKDFYKDYINTFLYYIDFASEESDEVPYFYSNGLKTAGLKKQEDLAYARGLLLSEGAETQSNGFYFLKSLLLKYYNTILLKPINIEHQSNLIVGNIYDVALVKRPQVSDKYDYKDYLIDLSSIKTDEKGNPYIEGYDGKIDMWIGFVIYKKFFPEVFDYIRQHKDELKENASLKNYRLGLSMEVWYNKYGYLYDLDESTIEEKNEKNSFLDDYIGKEWNNKKIYKVYLDKIIFAGAALTETAAEKRSFLLDVAFNSINIRGGMKNMDNKEDFIISLYNEKNDIKLLFESENDDMFDINIEEMDEDNLNSLIETAKEEKEDLLVNSLDESVRISKKKDGHESKPKKYEDVPLSQFADPTNYKYPLDSPKRVRAAIVYFTRYGGKYSPEEQKTIWRKIIRAAKKFGINVSEKVQKRAKSSNLDNKEVNFMIEKIKEYFDGLQEKLGKMMQENKIDEATVKALLAEEKLNLILKEIENKDNANKELSEKIKELSSTIETLNKEKSELEQAKKALEEEKSKMLEEIENLKKDLSNYKKNEMVEKRLNEIKSLGIEIKEDKIESLVEKASSYSDEEWGKYIEALKDIISVKKEENKKDTKDTSSESKIDEKKAKLIELGKMILIGSQKTDVAKKDNSSVNLSEKEREFKRIEGFAKNFSKKIR